MGGASEGMRGQAELLRPGEGARRRRRALVECIASGHLASEAEVLVCFEKPAQPVSLVVAIFLAFLFTKSPGCAQDL